MSCYDKYLEQNMLYNMCQVVLCNMCHVMLYKICLVMLYDIFYVMLYNIIPANSHACGLKTSISRPLTPADQFLTPD